MLIPSFRTLLPRLVASCEQGRLVPFIGSGMSRRACTDWPTFIAALEAAAGVRGMARLGSDSPRDLLIQRANAAVRILRRAEPGAFAKAVRNALLSHEPGVADVSPQMTALTRVWWPLVLTTNYDNCYAAAFHDARSDARQLAVVGRGAEDCQRVLTSLSTSGRSLLWALQGYLEDLPRKGLPSTLSPGLEEQLVVGHEEYRRITYRDLHFRRAFAEVFRQRSLLFLGAGLQETYLQELFGEVLEYYGPAARPHYAFVQRHEVDPEFMLARFQIVVVEYGDHDAVRRRLDRLAQAVTYPRWTALAWSWGRVGRSIEPPWKSTPDIEVVRGHLPRKTVEGDCLAVSAGGSGKSFHFSPGIRKVMEGWEIARPMPDKTVPPYLGEFTDRAVYAVRARDENDLSSLSHIHDASLALFQHVGRLYGCIHMQLLATGGQDKVGVSQAKWKVPNFPERFSFVQTVRAWAAWRKGHAQARCSLKLYVVSDTVYQDIASGRIDVLELLSCADVRFFAEVVQDNGGVERRLFQTTPDVTLATIAGSLQLPAAQWLVKVTPPPTLLDRWRTLNTRTLRQTLKKFGVVPGSTVHFKRRPHRR